MIKKFSSLKCRILNSNGFTLIELIIVFSVLSILSVVGIASFSNYSKNQAVSSDANNLVNNIKFLKSNAGSQSKPCGNGITLDGYGITFTTTGSKNTYSSYAVCTSSGVKTNYKTVSYPLSKSVSFNTTTSSTTVIKTIFFNVISNGLKITGLSGSELTNGGHITVSGYNATVNRIINIDADGTISISQ